MKTLIYRKDTGLSVALLISVLMIFFTKAVVSLTMPWTCKNKDGIDQAERTPHKYSLRFLRISSPKRL